MDDNQVYLPRLNISLDDFRQSLKFARYILEKKLHDKKSEQSKLVRLAFETAMVISYWRPFTRQNDFPGHAKLPLNKAVSEVLTENQAKLHKAVGDIRCTDVAHSDARVHLDERFDYGKPHLAAPYKSSKRLNKAETEMLGIMIRKWIDYLEKERASHVKKRKAKLQDSIPKVYNFS